MTSSNALPSPRDAHDLGPLRAAVVPRGQSGMTLVEIMLGLTITTMIMIPLGAWVVAVLRVSPVSSASMMRTIRSGFVAAYMPDDVASATAGDDYSGEVAPAGQEWWNGWSRSDCTGGPGAGGRKVLVLLASRDDLGTATSTTTNAPSLGQIKIVYSIAKSSGDSNTYSVWRRTCNAIDKAPLQGAKELFKGIDPAMARSKAECRSSGTDLPCRQVKVSLTPKGSTRPVVLNIMRRTDAEAALFVDDGAAVGNHVPSARVSLGPLVPTGNGQEVTATLDASASSDEDGSIVNYSWSIPDAPVDQAPNYTEHAGADANVKTITLPRAGTYSIELTVTDDRGASTTTYRRIVVQNRKPVAIGSVSVGSATIGVDPFSLKGSDSFDPDGSINVAASYWTLSGTSAGGSPGQIDLHGLDHDNLVLGSEWSPGLVSAMLVVVDSDGATDVWVGSLNLSAAPVPTTVEPTTTTIDSSTVPPSSAPPTTDVPKSTTTVPGGP